ncbi:hypothetical protein GCM10009836_40920 [Pseudonocardia ailaonensis]|uniref:histidine kinase n=1 Tax=Pseudonocardia ailaonensis TaxID=367279 RepID=A0ABN2N8K2_9PSEU
MRPAAVGSGGIGSGVVGPGASPAAGAPAPSVGLRVVGALYWVVLVLCSIVALSWLSVGAYVAAARYLPGFGAGDGTWARAVAAAAPASEPLDQLFVDYALTLVALGIAVTLLVRGGRSWTTRLLTLAMVGSAGAFNLQAHAAAAAVDSATGIAAGPIHQYVLHGAACAAYILALLVFPTVDSRLLARAGRSGRVVLGVLGVVVLGLVGFGTALLQHTTSCVLFFGLLVPLVGIAVLPDRIRRGPTAAVRTQARLVFSLLAAAFAAILVLGLVTLVLWLLGVPGLNLYDPTAHGAPGLPVALLFWASRLGSAAIAVAIFVAMRAERLWAAERLFSRVLAAVLAVAVVGGGVIVVEAIGWVSGIGPFGATLIASLLAAVTFLPVYRYVEGLTDRLLYGRRPTPYAALAEVAALSRTTSSDAPDLARVAEAVGKALGATRCRLTVVRPGLRDRTYAWSAPDGGVDDGAGLVAVPVRSGVERLGTLEVDRAAVAGLHAERRHLLEDIADSLGVVVAASRLGVELERQLRAALAHAAEIAVSRREAVSEMDGERRRIERDLHDGAQHQLVSLRLVLGLVEHEVDNGRVEQARERLGVLAGQLDTAESVLAETASGVRSIALAERGLVGALEAELAGPPAVPVESLLLPGRRFPLELEAAVYFCCLESVNNAHKHAPGADITVRFSEADGRLHFTVRDNGPGFVVPKPAVVGPGAATAGRGLRNVAARIVNAGGRVDLRSAPGEGTTVEGSVPVPPPPEGWTPAPVEATVRLAVVEPRPGAETGLVVDTAALPVRSDSAPTALIALPGRAGVGPAGAGAGGAGSGGAGSGGGGAAGPGSAAAGSGPAGPDLGGPGAAGPGAVGSGAGPAAAGPTAAGPAAAGAPAAEGGAGVSGSAAGPDAGGPQGERPEAGAPVEPEIAVDPTAPDPADGPLVAAVRAALAEIAAGVEEPARPAVVDVARGLDEPLRVLVDGPRGSGVSTLVAALTAEGLPAELVLVEGSAPERGSPSGPPAHDNGPALATGHGPGAGGGTAAHGSGAGPAGTPRPAAGAGATRPGAEPAAVLLLLTPAGPPTPGPPAIGVLGRADEIPGDPWELVHRLVAEPAVRRRCHAVHPVSARLALSAAAPGDPVHVTAIGARLAAELPPEQLAAELRRRSGVPRLAELLVSGVAEHADAHRARAALRALDGLAATLPPRRDGRLRYHLERLRSSAHEFAELDLVDGLRAGSPALNADDRAAAELLLGASGPAAHQRLGLAPDAGPDEIRLAAAAQLNRWQRHAAHPVATRDQRAAAATLIRTCERLMSDETLSTSRP